MCLSVVNYIQRKKDEDMRKWGLSLIAMVMLIGCTSAPKAPISGILAVDPIEYLSESKTETTSIFTGKTVYGNTYQAVGVMFENTTQARPQSGISLADVVYEIAVDSWQISRFLGIFNTNFPTKVGPVRSARFPFVRVIREWGIAFTHFGAGQTGLGNVLPLLRSTHIPDSMISSSRVIRHDTHRIMPIGMPKTLYR
jgi:hypothetical protein